MSCVSRENSIDIVALQGQNREYRPAVSAFYTNDGREISFEDVALYRNKKYPSFI